MTHQTARVQIQPGAFSGSVPQNYHKYLVPLIFEQSADDLVSRIDPGAAVLETACGTGVVTERLRKRLSPGARLIATDINEQMLAQARARLDGPGIEFRVADATDLPFEDGAFDAVVCQYGVMFFPDRIRGYAEAARVLKPGGRFIFNVWDSHEHNPLAGCVHRAVQALYPTNPPGFLEVPFAYHDIDLIESELRRAGFKEVRAEVQPMTCTAPSPRHVALALTTGTPLAPQLAERGPIEPATDAAEQAVRKLAGDGPISAPMQAITFTAQ